jgi:hypothetical protein
LSRAALLPAVLGLAGYAGLAAYGVTKLPHTGAWTLLLASAILAAAAVLLLARHLTAFVFAWLFLVGTGLGYAVAGAVTGGQSLTRTGGGEWAGVARLLIGGAAIGLFVAAGLSLMLAATLAISWRAVTAGRSAAEWIMSTAAALAAFGVLVWLVGAQLIGRRLFDQNRCLSGSAAQCHQLAGDERFSSDERSRFALRGCELGSDQACGLVVAALGPGQGRDSAAARAVAARCSAGNVDLCQRLGVRLLKLGDREGGIARLDESCTRDVRWCDSAASAAEEGGAPELARRLREAGCERDDARSCRGLLRQQPGALDPSELARLEVKTCLIGDVNDCRPLMRRDLERICALVCAGTIESQWHTCGYCAKDALAAGQKAIAEAWLASTCQRGYGWGCRDLEELRRQASDHSAGVILGR